MRPSSHVLDVGCGIGRLAYECAWYLDDDATYTGLDISPTVVDWLNANYAPRLPGFRFDYLDIWNELYHPKGAVRPEEARFPYEDDRFDVACAFEVFMHVSLDGFRNYLREIARVVRPGGLAVLTLVAVHPGEPPSLDEEYVQVGEGIWSSSPNRTASNMAYDIDLARTALTDAGLEEVGSVKGRIHIPFDRRPGLAPGVELPPIWHGCDVLAARTSTKRRSWRRSSRPMPASNPPPAQEPDPVEAGPIPPGTPAIGPAAGGNREATLSWAAPASDGGSPITGYAVTVYIGDDIAKTRIFNSPATTQTVTDLENGPAYRLRVRAYNAIGIGAYSDPTELITPMA